MRAEGLVPRPQTVQHSQGAQGGNGVRPLLPSCDVSSSRHPRETLPIQFISSSASRPFLSLLLNLVVPELPSASHRPLDLTFLPIYAISPPLALHLTLCVRERGNLSEFKTT